MSVAAALRTSSPLREKVETGKQGIKPRDRHCVEEKRPRIVLDSLDLDGAFHDQLPEENRWDYLVGTTIRSQKLIAIEVHPAFTSEVKVVVGKKRAAQAQLRAHLDPKARVQDWIWIASGSTRIAGGLSKTTPQARLLNSEGIRLVGSRLRLG